MTVMRVSEAAQVLGVSTDTVRRWADAGRLGTVRTAAGRRLIDAQEVARLAAARPPAQPPRSTHAHSARNRFAGIVTRVIRDRVAAQVEIQAGPFRVVSLLTREAVDELGLKPGMAAVASVKSTNVTVELPATGR